MVLGKMEACICAAVRIQGSFVLFKGALNFLKTRVTCSSAELGVACRTCLWDGEGVRQLAHLEHRVPVLLMLLVAGPYCC